MKNLFIAGIVALLAQFGISQSEDLLFEKDFRGKEVGLNVSPLLSKILPFQTASLKTGPYNITFRSGRNNRFFQMKLGANIPSFAGFTDVFPDIHVNLSFGFFRRRILGKNFTLNPHVSISSPQK